MWVDLAPSETTHTNKFVLRVVTQSHPWGYQRKDNNATLTLSDRRNALTAIRDSSDNKTCSYVDVPQTHRFPYDADLPIPLSFLLEVFSVKQDNGPSFLMELCKEHLPAVLKTKHFGSNPKSYFERLSERLDNADCNMDIFSAIKSLSHLEIPGIVVDQTVLKAEDEQSGEDPTLFVRLNSSGTRIEGEELIYSIYKASFPTTKSLVESIGARFVPASRVISLVARLALAKTAEGNYPPAMSIQEFKKRIKQDNFKSAIKELIGEQSTSPASLLFERAFKLLRCQDDLNVPPVLVKSLVKGSPDLLLLLLRWLQINDREASDRERRQILGTVTALSWFGRDNVRYVRDLWCKITEPEFWSKDILSIPFLAKSDFIMYPLVRASILRDFLLQDVVEKNTRWDDLYPPHESRILTIYRSTLKTDSEEATAIAARGTWDSFMNKLFACKSLVLFAQRKYINDSFGEFNQMETLEDTNTPWDWDHIYPSSWVDGKWYIDPNTKHWTHSIGNIRALSLEENRSENNRLSPRDRLFNEETRLDVRQQSFVRDDWKYWSLIQGRINAGETEKIKLHLSAVIHRLCNIYEEWYASLMVGELFDFENRSHFTTGSIK